MFLNLGWNAGIIGDQLQEQLAIENQIQDLNLVNKESDFLVKSFYYETQNGQFVPKTIFVDSDPQFQKKKIYAKQNFSSFRQMVEKCENLYGVVVINTTNQNYDNYIKEQQQLIPTVPFYFVNLIEDQISYSQQISTLKCYEMLKEYAEVCLQINGSVILENKQYTTYPPRNISQFLSYCLASINQAYKKVFDITTFSQSLFLDYDQKFLSCGFDNTYVNSFTNNFGGINYQEGKFNKTGLIIRGEPNLEQVKLVQDITQIPVQMGILEKGYPGIAQISNHSNNVNVLANAIKKFEQIPKQFFNIDYEVSESLKQIVAAYQ
ncbi:unnamed protein product (macronuclear) [Paramecium tetraurelia]|uniref:Uncharacterized protein n=1 Tax=Paramecium tetraurelia TaxID=5888 RepID=A0CXH6_PARTE|nr:uncharacterized protein GSPATT00011125001 [Paramecium tetraurelia]CAK75493.1 unnamed protein product [Paramecium tetraurelia]|eukprot:XP_001442890.1 hypothetical protein (macronuclear) [Paramecium tetraurelia strain d4-2]